jgi:hypothetical protein
VVAVGGAGEAPFSPWVEVVFAHQPAGLLGIDDMAAMPQVGSDAAVAVAPEDVGDGADHHDEFRVALTAIMRTAR